MNAKNSFYGVEFPFIPRKRILEGIEYVKSGKDFVQRLPTGYGKTCTEVVSIAKHVKNGELAVTLVPMKSLSLEKLGTIRKYLPEYKTILDDGDHDVEMEEYEDADILIMTFERFSSFLKDPNKRDYLNNIGLLHIDESHMIGDKERGSKLESLIIMTKFLFPDVHLVCSSATIDNIEEYAKKFNLEVVSALPEERPVPLTKKVVVHQKGWKSSEKAMIKADVCKRIMAKHRGKKFLIFVTSRARTRQIAKILAGFNPKKRINSNDLIDQSRIGFHNAGLSIKEKQEVERKFRDGLADVLVTTPTLAVGVNLPADVVIMGDMYFFDFVHGETIIDKNSLEQTLGRAGRPNLSDHGYAYILCNHESEAEVRSLVNEQFNVESHLKDNLNYIVLEWITSQICKEYTDVFQMLTHIYDKTITSEDLIKALEFLEKHRFIFNKSGVVKSTKKGRLTSYFQIKPKTVVHWESCVPLIKKHKIKHLFCFIASAEEYAKSVVPYRYDQNNISAVIRELRSINPELTEKVNSKISPEYIDHVFKIYAYTFDKEDYLSNVKMSSGDRYLINKMSERYIEAFKALIYGFNEECTKLQFSAKAGTFDKDKLELLSIKGIGEKTLNKLNKNGINSVSDFLNASISKLRKHCRISEKNLKNIKAELSINKTLNKTRK